MKVTELITDENNEVVKSILHTSKRDALSSNAVEALNKLSTFRGIEFEDGFGHEKGISESLRTEIMWLMQKLEKAQYGKF